MSKQTEVPKTEQFETKVEKPKTLLQEKANEWMGAEHDRETQGRVVGWGGIIGIGLGLTGLADRWGLGHSYSAGGFNIFKGITDYQESKLMKASVDQASTSEDLKDRSQAYETLSYIPVLPALILALNTSSLGLVVSGGALLMSVLRIRQARAARKQLDAHAEFMDNGEKAKITARDWLEKESNREIPEKYAKYEKWWNYAKLVYMDTQW